MIDTHAHLDECAESPEALLARARAAGVERVVTVGLDLEGDRAALALAERYEGVFAALGVHPHRAGTDTGQLDRLDELSSLLVHPRAVAVGETGLDFFRDYAPRDLQRRLFEAQLELATRLGKPVVIHSRAAEEPTAELLAGFRGTVVLHCFTSPGLLPVALERGYYVSFAGNVTYPGAAELREAAALVPADRLLAETDCPYLSPQPARGRRCEPAFVMHTLRALAEVRGDDPIDLAGRIDANAAAAFGLPP